MGKPKNKGKSKKKGYSAPKRNTSVAKERKTEDKVKDNPFEIQVNKRKHVVLGRQGRQEMGHPGLAKSRGITKRNRTLLKAYLTRGTTNSLVDRRIGERSNTLPEEAKIVRRSAVEKKKQYRKKSIFNLNDDEEEILTHGGRSLDTVGRYEDPRESSDSEDERLNEAFVGEANFGGGFMKRKSMTEGEDLGVHGPEIREKSRAEIIGELILASKARKGIKSAADAQLYEQICHLDDSLKKMDQELLLKKGINKDNSTIPTTLSAYDRSLKELQFEKKGQASDRLKTGEEIAEDKKIELERLENEQRNKYSLDEVMFFLKILYETQLDSLDEIKKMLPLCSALHEFTKDSKCYSPEVIRFLGNILRCFDSEEILNLNNTNVIKLFNLPIEEQLKLIQEILSHIKKFINLYKHLASAFEIFSPIKIAIQRLKSLFELMETTKDIQNILVPIDSTIKRINSLKMEKESLKMKRPKPKMLRMYDPEISLDFMSPTKKKKTSKEDGWLAAKVKKETKGAIRELKKDNAFLERQQRKEESQNDAERNIKVKALMSSLANQEGEYQKLKKTK